MDSPDPPPSSRKKVDGCSPQMAEKQDLSPNVGRILSVIDTCKQQVAAARCVYVMKRMHESKLKLDEICNQRLMLSQEQRNNIETGGETSIYLLTKKMNDVTRSKNGFSSVVKNGDPPINLAAVERLPPYTTWKFLNRNQIMTEDQSVVGRRRIYYGEDKGETLICSDSEEEKIDEEEFKKEFQESEDYIIQMTITEAGSSDAVMIELAQCLSRAACEIMERYRVLAKGHNSLENLGNPLFDKDLEAALDSFDNLFCRRCFVFDCKLHGCSQDLIFPADKQQPWSGPGDENAPCGPHCYKLVLKPETNLMKSSTTMDSEEKPPSNGCSGNRSSKKKPVSPSGEKIARSCQSKSGAPSAKSIFESSKSETRHMQNTTYASQSSSPKSKHTANRETPKRISKQLAEHVLSSTPKRQKKTRTSNSDTSVAGNFDSVYMKLPSDLCQGSQVPMPVQKPKAKRGRPRKIPLTVDSQKTVQLVTGEGPTNEIITKKIVFSKLEASETESWKTIERSLYLKGLEIFGRNSCLITRNLLSGMKTCSEVFQFMNCSENRGDGANSMPEGQFNDDDNNETTANEARRRSRYLRRRGRVRRLKCSWKSAGYQSYKKRISDKKDQPCRQFNPCGCGSACGKECPCHANETCCEKYCGCPKTCKNRFRGCHCAKSQCRSRQCPCFAADRECDPDVCRNCWIGCRDGSLGGPPQRGDNYECRNMNLLLKQQQRVLLGPSDVSGWGAFLKNNVGKNEYLGEYTGEVISHREADKRGKIYDRENQSFLFNLNDQFVLDALRRGDKLKFANHSPEPNCYAKVMLVAGDHRVGIYSNKRIGAGEELFYDYRYTVDARPAWWDQPEAPGFKKSEAGSSNGRAKKLA